MIAFFPDLLSPPSRAPFLYRQSSLMLRGTDLSYLILDYFRLFSSLSRTFILVSSCGSSFCPSQSEHQGKLVSMAANSALRNSGPVLSNRETAFVEAISGSLAGALAMALTYPLDQARTLQQVEASTAAAAAADLSPSALRPAETSRQQNLRSLGALAAVVHLAREEGGIRALYRGCNETCQTVAVSNFIYFYLCQWVQQKLRPRSSAASADHALSLATDNLRLLVSNTVAGVVNVVLTEPLWRVSTVLKIELRKAPNPQGQQPLSAALPAHNSFSRSRGAAASAGAWSPASASPSGSGRAMKKIRASVESRLCDLEQNITDEALELPPTLTSKCGGSWTALWRGLVHLPRLEDKPVWAALWGGTTVSMWLVSNPVIQFWLYNLLKASKNKKSLSSVEAFLIGAVAKAVATLATYPLQVAQARIRAARSAQKDLATHNLKGIPITSAAERERRRGQEVSSVLECLADICHKEGLGGLFNGFEAKLYQTVGTAAFMFLFYEKIRALLTRTLLGLK